MSRRPSKGCSGPTIQKQRCDGISCLIHAFESFSTRHAQCTTVPGALYRCHASFTDAQAEEFLEHLSRAVVAELDGSLNNLQLLFGVNTVARAEFQRIQQELTHWNPLVVVSAGLPVSRGCREMIDCLFLEACPHVWLHQGIVSGGVPQ